MPLSPEELYLAESCYGYGRWDADYWFIGPEQGMGKETVEERARAFREADGDEDGLCDCREFHLKIYERRWHQAVPRTGRVKLQSTWRYLILILMAFKRDRDGLSNLDSRAKYQEARLGTADPKLGETCVIELAGLSSKDLKATRERDKRRPDEDKELLGEISARRVKNISAKKRTPKFVLMYGFSEENKKYWATIAGTDLKLGIPKKVGQTIFLADRHPLYTGYDYWIQMGENMRTEFERND
jgi:hypothetical protein